MVNTIEHFSIKLILFTLTICSFAISMSEYVAMGILSVVSTDLNVSITETGLLVSLYAMSVTIFSPILTILFLKFPQKYVLLIMMGIFIFGNLLSAVTTTFILLVISRVIAASMHGSFFAVAMVLASEIVPYEKRTQAISTINIGLTLALMLGVPFSSYLAALIGWRFVYAFIAIFGMIGFIGILRVVPIIQPVKVPKFNQEMKIFKNRDVIFSFIIIIFSSSGVFIVYTFIEPMLRKSAGFYAVGVASGLFCFGVGGVLGNYFCGRVQTQKLIRILARIMISLTVVLFLFPIALTNKISTFLIIILFGAGLFGYVPLLQTKIINAARAGRTLAASVSVSAFNLANALGAWIGGTVLVTTNSYKLLPIFGSAITFLAFFTILINIYMDKRREKKKWDY
ncbi:MULTISPECIES: MFS transporter [Bacillus cereus group]|uniref:MFS transporter n=1 Tax=Bacillus bombysepticus str. Wang TaxID=1330043 RepID=A0A9W3L527_9BACI|nr:MULTISPECIES: MFS transporter [Bacillus cereus group]AHX21654.1 MFS transporter [Bacillus bombysepticus str. Wang]MCE9758245.1 MFS transporter [Bacillus cereus]